MGSYFWNKQLGDQKQEARVYKNGIFCSKIWFTNNINKNKLPIGFPLVKISENNNWVIDAWRQVYYGYCMLRFMGHDFRLPAVSM